jgi:ATP-dependent DNA ligase
MPGGTQYSIKLDGWRCLVFVLPGGQAVLQSRAGRVISDRFPAIASAAAASLPAGTVADGELVAWKDGRMDFEELLRTDSARRAHGTAVSLILFDLLAAPGGHDLRDRPLSERWQRLTDLLAAAGPPIQPVMATTDRATALTWHEALRPQGVEGLVCKALAGPYNPRDKRAWVKVRHSDTLDTAVLAVAGTPRRPRALLLELPGGTRRWSSPQLDTRQARLVADALAGLLGAPVDDPDQGRRLPVEGAVRAEVQLGTGRHSVPRFVRIRGD